MQVYASTDESDVGAIRPNQRATFKVETLFQGRAGLSSTDERHQERGHIQHDHRFR